MGDTPFVSERIIDGKAVAAQIRTEVAATVKHLHEKHGKVGAGVLLLPVTAVAQTMHSGAHAAPTMMFRV